MAVTAVQEVVEGGAFVGVFGVLWLRVARDSVRRGLFERRVLRRSRQSEAIAAEAALEDAAFEPARIRQAVKRVLDAAGEVWDGHGSDPFGDVPDGDMIVSWAQKHERGWSLRSGDPRVDVLRVVNRDPPERKRVEVRVRVKVWQDHVHRWSADRSFRVDQRWGFWLDGDEWRFDAFGPRRLAEPVLAATQIASPAQDEARLSDQALQEIAVSQPVARDVSALVRAGASAESQLRELAAVDDRFAPALIESTLRQLVGAWERPTRTSGKSNTLSERATNRAVVQLLRPETAWPGATMILRDASLQEWRVLEVRQTDAGPELDLELTVLARHFLSRGNDVSSQSAPGDVLTLRPIALRWTLRAIAEPPPVWQLIASSNPAAAIPGAIPS